jgi:hypothetical protein
MDLLDSPSFYTTGDLLKGHLRVDPTMRPTRISVSLKAYSIINGPKSCAPQTVLLECTQDLFVSKGAGLGEYELLRRGTSRDGKVELPFFFTFPQHVSLPPPENRNWVNPDDVFDHPRFQHSPGFVLPPSCATGTDRVYRIYRQQRIELLQQNRDAALSEYMALGSSPKVIYQLEARRESETKPCSKVRQEIRFIPPAPEYNPALLQPDPNFGFQHLPGHSRHKLIRTRKLLPNYEQYPKREKFKVLLMDQDIFGMESDSVIPYVKFNIFATAARILVIGSHVPVTITVQHLERSETVPHPPDLFLRRIKVKLHCLFNTFVPPNPKLRRDPDDRVHTEKDEFTLCDKRYEKENGEPLYNGLNLLDVADIKLENDILVPSFTSYGVNLEHEISIEIWGECAGKEWQGYACMQPVQLVSDWHAPGIHPHDAGPEARPPYLDMHNIDGDADAQALQEDIPAYAFEAPPPISPPVPAVPPPPYAG